MTGLLETLPFFSCPWWFPGLFSISSRDDIGRERNENKVQLTEGTKGTSSVPHPHPCPSRYQWQGLGQPEWKKGEALLFYSNHLPGASKDQSPHPLHPTVAQQKPLARPPHLEQSVCTDPQGPLGFPLDPMHCLAWSR